MTEIIYIDELIDAHDGVRSASWVLDNIELDSYSCDKYTEDYHKAQREFDELLEAYAVQEGIKDVQALRLVFQAYVRRQRKIDEAHERRSDDNLQRFYNDVGRLSEDDE